MKLSQYIQKALTDLPDLHGFRHVVDVTVSGHTRSWLVTYGTIYETATIITRELKATVCTCKDKWLERRLKKSVLLMARRYSRCLCWKAMTSGTNDTYATTDTGHLTRLKEPPAIAIRDAKFRPSGIPDPKNRPGQAFWGGQTVTAGLMPDSGKVIAMYNIYIWLPGLVRCLKVIVGWARWRAH